MVSSTDAADDGHPSDGLELVTVAAPEDQTPVDESSPELRTLILDDAPTDAPTDAPALVDPAGGGQVEPLPHDDVYAGDGDEIDLIDGVDPQPEYQPALIDLDDDVMVIDQPETDVSPEVVDVPDTLMAVDDYGDVL